MRVIWAVRFWLLVIVACAVLMLTGCASIITKDCMRNDSGTWVCVERQPPTEYQHFNDIRAKAKSWPEGTKVRFTLNDGSRVYGTLLRYEGATDYIWYQPQDTGNNWFRQDAFDVHEIMCLDMFEI